jgi:hypothetical protein
MKGKTMTQEAAINEAMNRSNTTKCLDLGRLVATAGVASTMNELPEEESFIFNRFLAESLSRHTVGDWGDVCEEDWEINDDSFETGGRILSAYEPEKRFPQLSPDLKIWIITECDRSATTILYPHEY